MPDVSMDQVKHCLFTVDGQFGQQGDNTGAIRKAIGDDAGSDRILLWFHGGLVDTASGTEMAQRVGRFLIDRKVFPVFTVWETGLKHSLIEALEALVKRKLTQGAVKLLSALLHAKLPAASLGFESDPNSKLELTALDKQILSEAMKQDRDFQDEEMSIRAALDEKTPTMRLQLAVNGPVTPADEEIDRRIIDKYSKQRDQQVALGLPNVWSMLGAFLFEVAEHTLDRFSKGRDHGIVQTIIEEAARAIELPKDTWTQMKTFATQNFESNGAARKLLSSICSDATVLKGRELILVGHSTGAIMISNLLDAAVDVCPNQKFRVCFLAGAARCDLIAGMLSKHASRITHIRCFGMDDEHEKIEALFGEIPGIDNVPFLANAYKGSLLYMVSGALENEPDAPLVGMQRFLSLPGFLTDQEKTNVQAITKFQPPIQFVFTPTASNAPAGFRSPCVSHGGFDDMAELGDDGAVGSLLVS